MYRSNRYKEVSELVDKNKIYTIEEALELAKKTSKVKFTPTVEVHVKLSINLKKTEEQVRGSAILPHGTGKTKKVAIFTESDDTKELKALGADFVGGEELIEEILKTQKTDFDVAIATPAMMIKLSKLSRVLGPKGLMPNPKTGTVTPDVKNALKEQKAGKVSFKNDKTGNIHQAIGKGDFTTEKLAENFNVLMEAIKASKPESVKKNVIKSISINSTMGPGIKVSYSA